MEREKTYLKKYCPVCNQVFYFSFVDPKYESGNIDLITLELKRAYDALKMAVSKCSHENVECLSRYTSLNDYSLGELISLRKEVIKNYRNYPSESDLDFIKEIDRRLENFR